MTTNAWVPELRQITFLYMVLEDIAYEWEAAQRLSDIIYTCQWEFNHYGSCLDSVFVDGDKTVITSVWGLPTATFEGNKKCFQWRRKIFNKFTLKKNS